MPSGQAMMIAADVQQVAEPVWLDGDDLDFPHSEHALEFQ